MPERFGPDLPEQDRMMSKAEGKDDKADSDDDRGDKPGHKGEPKASRPEIIRKV